MRRAQELYVRPGAQKSASTSVPAPVGGLNARDALANMKATDAIRLDNLFPQPTSIEVRKGRTAWSTFTGTCQTILVYNSGVATKVFPCVKNGSVYSIYDGTSSGALSSAAVGGAGNTVQALTSARFDYQNFGTTGGQFLTVVNGADAPLQYNGTAWSASTMTGGTPANYFTVAAYHRRLFFGVKDSLSVRYLPVDSITGATTLLDLGPLFHHGGYLNSVITVTDALNQLTAYIGFMSSEGEIVAFAGTDPSSASTWEKCAQFRIGRPLIKGNRAWCAWGSDALVLTSDGVIPLRKQIQEGGERKVWLSISDKIRPLLNNDAQVHGARYGWQIIVHPTGSKLYVNVPTTEDVASRQWVMNTQTQAWGGPFYDQSAFCFEVARDTLWMGMEGKMVKADTGLDDEDAAISWRAEQAYHYYGSRGRTKHMKLLRPNLAVDGEYEIEVHVNLDFKSRSIPTLQLITGGGGDPWGGVWDVAWSGAVVASLRWHGISGEGHAISTAIRGRTNGVSLSWSASDVVYELGGVIG